MIFLFIFVCFDDKLNFERKIETKTNLKVVASMVILKFTINIGHPKKIK